MSESAASETTLVGQSIDGRYRLEEQLGTGTQGVTYRARHIEHQRVVALKLLHEDVSGDALRRGRFEWEAATLAALGHPNIVTVVDYGVHEGRRWVAGEWLEGETLAERIARGALPLMAAMSIVRQLLAALASAHAARLVHRNLKPSNVFLERRTAQGRERVKLLDFAPALRTHRGPAPAAVPAELLSPYTPPELAAGELLDSRSDVFAVGATLIGMLSGEAAFEPLPCEAQGVRPSSPDRARALPGVDATLMAWIRRATATQRSVRFADAADMLRELIDLLPRDLRSPPDGSDGTSRPVTMPVSSPPPLPNVRPAAVPPPLPSRRVGTPPPLPKRRKTGEVSLPPPPAIPIEAQANASAGFKTILQKPAPDDEVPSADPPGGQPASPVVPQAAPRTLLGARSEIGRGTLRPVESKVIAPSADPRVQQLMAAAVFGAFLVAAFVIFLQPGGEERATTPSAASAPAARRGEAQDPMERKPPPAKPNARGQVAAKPIAPVDSAAADRAKPEQPAAAPAPLPKQPRASAPAAQPTTTDAAAAPRTAALSIVAAPGRPPVRDPWQDPLPPELGRARELALNGAAGDEDRIKLLREYNRDHPRDPRGYLVIGQFFANRLWRTDAVEEIERALDRDVTARGAPEILPTLLAMVAQGKAQPLAEKLILRVYGSEALDSIEAAFDDVKKPGDAARLHALRLKITGGVPQH